MGGLSRPAITILGAPRTSRETEHPGSTGLPPEPKGRIRRRPDPILRDDRRGDGAGAPLSGDLATDTLAEAATYLRDAGVEVEVAIVHDRPAASLLDVALQRDASMIGVGTNGESPMVGAILGSVPQKLLHRSLIPVLVVPAPQPPG